MKHFPAKHSCFDEIKIPQEKIFIFAGIFHLVVHHINFNLCIAGVTIFFGLLCFSPYIETGDSESLKAWAWLCPASITE